MLFQSWSWEKSQEEAFRRNGTKIDFHNLAWNILRDERAIKKWSWVRTKLNHVLGDQPFSFRRLLFPFRVFIIIIHFGIYFTNFFFPKALFSPLLSTFVQHIEGIASPIKQGEVNNCSSVAKDARNLFLTEISSFHYKFFQFSYREFFSFFSWAHHIIFVDIRSETMMTFELAALGGYQLAKSSTNSGTNLQSCISFRHPSDHFFQKVKK